MPGTGSGGDECCDWLTFSGGALGQVGIKHHCRHCNHGGNHRHPGHPSALKQGRGKNSSAINKGHYEIDTPEQPGQKHWRLELERQRGETWVIVRDKEFKKYTNKRRERGRRKGKANI